MRVFIKGAGKNSTLPTSLVPFAWYMPLVRIYYLRSLALFLPQEALGEFKGTPKPLRKMVMVAGCCNQLVEAIS